MLRLISLACEVRCVHDNPVKAFSVGHTTRLPLFSVFTDVQLSQLKHLIGHLLISCFT